MTNGDFAFFTFHALQSVNTEKPWTSYSYVDDQNDLPRRQQAYYAVKKVLEFICCSFHWFFVRACVRSFVHSYGTLEMRRM